MDMCRTCAGYFDGNDDNWFDLFHPVRCKMEMHNIRMESDIWKLQIKSNDGLPQKICKDCFTNFSRVYTFRRKCQEAQITIRNMPQNKLYNSQKTTDSAPNNLMQREFNGVAKKPIISSRRTVTSHRKSFSLNASMHQVGNKEITMQFPVSSGQQHSVPHSHVHGLSLDSGSTQSNPTHEFGKFTGSTGTKGLSARERYSQPQMTSRRKQQNNALPLKSGNGMKLLSKMGWKPGEGLGLNNTGCVQPLQFNVKNDKLGLGSTEKPPQPQNASKKKVKKNLKPKNPISLLNELSNKRKIQPPQFTIINEIGPSHSKMFMFSVTFNGQTFKPSNGANTKNEAKAIAAQNCLQKLGIKQ